MALGLNQSELDTIQTALLMLKTKRENNALEYAERAAAAAAVGDKKLEELSERLSRRFYDGVDEINGILNALSGA